MRACRLSTRNCEKKVGEIFTTQFHFDHLLTQVPKSWYFLNNSEPAKKNSHTFFWAWLQRSGLSQKRSTNALFWF